MEMGGGYVYTCILIFYRCVFYFSALVCRGARYAMVITNILPCDQKEVTPKPTRYIFFGTYLCYYLWATVIY